ncbi:MAG: hypothetical protein L6Q92_07115 [Phycisphaerae bacterium]|nr:hypothetical protein [Phycisphaerae bacterium]
MSEQPERTCEKCGATIPNDHIARKLAGLVSGKLLCAACVDALRKQVAASRSGLIQTPNAAPASPSGDIGAKSIVGATTTTAASRDNHEEPIQLISDSERSSGDDSSKLVVEGGNRIQTLGARGTFHTGQQYKRALAGTEFGASRVRTFHARISQGAMAHLDSIINEWLEANPDIYIKHATATVGLFEAKQHTEHHLIITLFF